MSVKFFVLKSHDTVDQNLGPLRSDILTNFYFDISKKVSTIAVHWTAKLFWKRLVLMMVNWESSRYLFIFGKYPDSSILFRFSMF